MKRCVTQNRKMLIFAMLCTGVLHFGAVYSFDVPEEPVETFSAPMPAQPIEVETPPAIPSFDPLPE